MKYLKKFSTLETYQAATLETPNVSLIESNMSPIFNPYIDPANGHDYVEICGIKWGTMNLGANSVTDSGLFYQWGDTQGYSESQIGVDKIFNETDYKYYSNDDFTKYNETDELISLLPEDDAAHLLWGGKWRMPTYDDFCILQLETIKEWTNNYEGTGIGGVIYKDKINQNNKIFLPYCGQAFNDSVTGIGAVSMYWSSDMTDNIENTNDYDKEKAQMLFIMNNNAMTNPLYRYLGANIRPVLDI